LEKPPVFFANRFHLTTSEPKKISRTDANGHTRKIVFLVFRSSHSRKNRGKIVFSFLKIQKNALFFAFFEKLWGKVEKSGEFLVILKPEFI